MSETFYGTIFYCSLSTTLSKAQVADLYRGLGWTVRKSSWSDYEVICPFAELVIEADNPVLLHGPMASLGNNVDRILAPLREAGVRYSAECCAKMNYLLLSDGAEYSPWRRSFRLTHR